MKIDKGHIALALAPFALAGVSAFLNYEVNSPHPFDKQTMAHAAIATLLVVVALVKRSVFPENPS